MWFVVLAVLLCLRVSSAATTTQLALVTTEFRIPAGQTAALSLTPGSRKFASDVKEFSSITVPQGEHEIAMGRDRETNEWFLAVPLTMPPGAYAVTVSLERGDGERQEATVQVQVDPLRPIPQTSRPPVLLLLRSD